MQGYSCTMCGYVSKSAKKLPNYCRNCHADRSYLNEKLSKSEIDAFNKKYPKIAKMETTPIKDWRKI